MGFAPERVDWALYVTKNAGLQPTLDHLEANQDNPVPTDYKSVAPAAGSSSAGAGHDVSSSYMPMQLKRGANLLTRIEYTLASSTMRRTRPLSPT